ncbi:hypothetical protein GQR58_017963 [Nymphon striatum]|nr:hypothetical protein GQR58_017963 [Nymphon striatum]
MSTQKRTAPRGRPKSLDRDHLIEIAKESFWAEGPTHVSINEICKRSGVSKPSPKGCLLQDMFASRDHMGELTADTIDTLRAETLGIYEYWIARAKENGEISTDLSNPSAAIYVDLQLASAMVLMKRPSVTGDRGRVFENRVFSFPKL